MICVLTTIITISFSWGRLQTSSLLAYSRGGQAGGMVKFLEQTLGGVYNLHSFMNGTMNISEEWKPDNSSQKQLDRFNRKDYGNYVNNETFSPNTWPHLRPRSPWNPPLKEQNVRPGAAVNNQSEIDRLNAQETINILVWGGTPGPVRLGTGHKPFQYYQCPIWNCNISKNKTLFKQADALLFHMAGPRTKPNRKKLPHQKYIFFTRETPKMIHINRKLKSIFDVTMSHRLDSDIPHPYGVIVPLEPGETRPPANHDYAVGKTKLVAWVVSNCRTQSHRGLYVRKLQEHIYVDIYGKCGDLDCPKYTTPNCFTKINKTHKFYLAFENSLCEDYATEKLYSTLNRGGLVPIVLGNSNYTQLLPPNSYIDIRDFKDPQDLARYLYYINDHDDVYNSYFAWRMEYKVVATGGGLFNGPWFCRLCEYLQRTRGEKKKYDNVAKWYGRARCITRQQYYSEQPAILSALSQGYNTSHDLG